MGVTDPFCSLRAAKTRNHFLESFFPETLKEHLWYLQRGVAGVAGWLAGWHGHPGQGGMAFCVTEEPISQIRQQGEAHQCNRLVKRAIPV